MSSFSTVQEMFNNDEDFDMSCEWHANQAYRLVEEHLPNASQSDLTSVWLSVWDDCIDDGGGSLYQVILN